MSRRQVMPILGDGDATCSPELIEQFGELGSSSAGRWARMVRKTRKTRQGLGLAAVGAGSDEETEWANYLELKIVAPLSTTRRRQDAMRRLPLRRWLQVGGVIAGVVMIGFGVSTIVLGANGVDTVRDNLARESIEGTGEPSLNGSTIPEGELVDTGGEARDFADLMRKHALEGAGGKSYAELGRFVTPEGEDTSDIEAAAKNPDGSPVANPARDTWITQTALATALNVAYFGEQVSLFGIMVGVALLLSGLGFIILALAALRDPNEAKVSPEPATAAAATE